MKDLREGDEVEASRAAERIFSVTKLLLDRNPNTRVAVLNPLIITHDRSHEELAKMWGEFHGEEVMRLATKAIETCPKTVDMDEMSYTKLASQAKEGEGKLTKVRRDATIAQHLIEKQIIKQGDKVDKLKEAYFAPGDATKLHPRLTTTAGRQLTLKFN